MKIGFLLSSFLPTQTGGTEVYVYRLIRHLQELNFSCFVLNSSKDEELKESLCEGIRVISIPSAALNLNLRKEVLSHLIEIESPDIIHVHELISPDGFSIHDLELFRQFSIPLLTTLHVLRYSCFMQDLRFHGKSECNGIPDNSKCTNCFLARKGIGILSLPLTLFSGFLHNNGFKFSFLSGKIATVLRSYSIVSNHLDTLEKIISQTSGIITVANWYYEILKSIVPADLLHFIPTGNYCHINATKNSKKEELVFGYLGRLSPDKGIDLLIDSFLLSCSNLHQLNIYADISDEDDLFIKSLINKTSIYPNIKWCKPFQPESLYTVLEQIDVLVVPSRITEMSPLVIHEARAAGKFVIASNNKGNVESLKGYNHSFIYQENTIQSLAGAIDIIVEGNFTFSSLSESIDSFTFEDTTRQYIELYKKLKSNKLPSVSSLISVI